MFCDLVGSTALSARLDPEDLRSIITAYHRCCTELVERNGGFVAKYMGDGGVLQRRKGRRVEGTTRNHVVKLRER
jgi:class 3 adenylate cyclase